MKPIVPVVFATDDIFAPYCGATIASLLANRDPERSYAIYVFYDELSPEHIEKLSGMAVQNVSVECINITPYVDHDLLYTRRRLTLATYYRFFVTAVLPQYDKILYLDSDIAILGDVGELYDFDIGDHLLGGVVIYRGSDTEQKLKEEYLRELMDVSPERYVNAGVLIMNLRAFREQGIEKKCLDYLADHRELRWLDQDVLNAVCKGQIFFLPEGWNMSQFYYEDDYQSGADVSGVKLIHYITNIKPWAFDCRCAHLPFYRYAALCPYADELMAMFLENNKKRTTSADRARRAARKAEKEAAQETKKQAKLPMKEMRQQMLQLSLRGRIGPKFLLRCFGKWLKGRLSSSKPGQSAQA